MTVANRRIVFAALGLAVLLGTFWFLLMAPKREEAASLGSKAEGLRADVAAIQSQADAAEEAKRGFAGDYEQLVLLGKAVPADDDSASLIVTLNQLAKKSGIKFESILLDEAGAAAAGAPVAPPVVPVPPVTDGSAVPAATAVPATEVSAALLPIGATIGSAGFGVMPYKLSFTGEYFEIADFLGRLDKLVKTGTQKLAADGRLLTVDGFSLDPDEEAGFPDLSASMSVTTYLTPPNQGLTAGATPAAPALPVDPATTPVAATP